MGRRRGEEGERRGRGRGEEGERRGRGGERGVIMLYLQPVAELRRTQINLAESKEY